MVWDLYLEADITWYAKAINDLIHTQSSLGLNVSLKMS